ncbi:MAG: hypothetical protein KDK48_05140, partial [Chlamydiia bacterium]|nr:hypothetical protein [Chlamydiia bacterium]
MKVRLASREHLECRSRQPFINGTLLFSLLIAVALHGAFAAIVHIRDLLPGAERIHPFTDVQAELPAQSLESVTLEMAHKIADFLPAHPESVPKPYLPEVQKPTFFPGAGRLLAEADPEGTLKAVKSPMAALILSSHADALIEVKEGATLDFGKQSKTLAVLIDPKEGRLVPLKAKDAELV